LLAIERSLSLLLQTGVATRAAVCCRVDNFGLAVVCVIEHRRGSSCVSSRRKAALTSKSRQDVGIRLFDLGFERLVAKGAKKCDARLRLLICTLFGILAEQPTARSSLAVQFAYLTPADKALRWGGRLHDAHDDSNTLGGCRRAQAMHIRQRDGEGMARLAGGLRKMGRDCRSERAVPACSRRATGWDGARECSAAHQEEGNGALVLVGAEEERRRRKGGWPRRTYQGRCGPLPDASQGHANTSAGHAVQEEQSAMVRMVEKKGKRGQGARNGFAALPSLRVAQSEREHADVGVTSFRMCGWMLKM